MLLCVFQLTFLQMFLVISEELENVPCAAYPHYIHTDPRHFSIYPHVVKIHRCFGMDFISNARLKHCIKNTSTLIKYINLRTGIIETIYNYTSCHLKCIRNKSVCNQYQKWNDFKCKCDCKYTKVNAQLCCSPEVWNDNDCNCACPFLPRVCSERQYWDNEACKCECKPETREYCVSRHLEINLNTCGCSSRGSSVKQVACSGKKISNEIVIIIVICEALFLTLCLLICWYFKTMKMKNK